MKTAFPSILGLLLNRHTMYPLHMLQKIVGRSKCPVVLYLEATLPATDPGTDW
jgi:hypothetical protein